MNKGIHKLALASKILLDKEVIQLRQENELLRLKLFWKDHKVDILKQLMQEANQAEDGPHCKCCTCAVSGRIDEGDESIDMKCVFKPWFESHLMSCGLTYQTAAQEGNGVQHMSGDGNFQYDVDTHIHHIVSADWFAWTYGARLWKANSADDPELIKLHSLFERLQRIAHGNDE